jgi:lipopolysaccharide transport protein LptA
MKKLRIFFYSLCLLIGLATNLICLTNSEIALDADNIEFDGIKNLVIASGNVRVFYHEKKLLITCLKAEYSNEKKQVKLAGNVVLTKDQLTLNCTNLNADLKKNQVDATGGVKFIFSENIKGNADTANYNLEQNSLTLSGNASAYNGEDMLSGQNILILLNEKKVITKGRTSIIISPERYQ